MTRKRSPHYFEKRRRELAKKQKRQQKIERSQGRRNAEETVGEGPGSEEPEPKSTDSAESGLPENLLPPATEPGLHDDEK